jgi:23S rRNA (pseudouridine1915-N3)-methyltransferase
MRVHLISVGRRMPPWVDAGYSEYAKRLPAQCSLHLVEVEPLRRVKGGSPDQSRIEEGERTLRAIPKGAGVTALDLGGQAWSTEELARQIRVWMGEGRDRALLVGGADGLSAACLERADQRWSLSNLTFPHQMVRILVAEQIYRAWSLLKGHPYHRG